LSFAGDQEFTAGTFTVDVPFDRLHEVQGENKWLREQIFGYRACLFVLLGLMVIWPVVLMFNRTPPPRLSACEALKYYLSALDEAPSELPVETRQLLNTQAAACPDEDLDGFDDVRA
jgi:hypothetical protein